MRKPTYAMSLALIGLLLLGAGCKKSATIEANTTTDTHVEANADEHADAEHWAVDVNNSSLIWNASKVTGKHVGSIKLQSGELLVHDGVPVGGSFTVDMATITDQDVTNEKMNAMLVNDLKSDNFFAVATYPTAQFDIVATEHVDGNKYLVLGNLTIRGITKLVNFEATIDLTADSASATGTVTVDRTDFDIKFRSGKFFSDLGDKLVDDEFTLTLDVKAKK